MECYNMYNMLDLNDLTQNEMVKFVQITGLRN